MARQKDDMCQQPYLSTNQAKPSLPPPTVTITSKPNGKHKSIIHGIQKFVVTGIQKFVVVFYFFHFWSSKLECTDLGLVELEFGSVKSLNNLINS